MKSVLLGTLAVIVFLGFAYGMFWVAKHGSYAFFYEDMVKQTIVETVKPESLK